MIAYVLRAIFPCLERLFRFLRTDARQEYLLGTLSTDAPVLIERLREHGFEDQIFAWVDDGQVASLRKRDGEFQYHLRIFNDGEVRGHYEYAPEVAPFKHLQRLAQEAREAFFLSVCGDDVCPTRECSSVKNYATCTTDMQVHPRASYSGSGDQTIRAVI